MTTATPAAPRRPPSPRPAAGRAPAPDRPERPAGLELVGRFEDSGFKDPPYLVRRRDGQVIQLSRLLYLVAEAADGRRDAEEIAARVGPRAGRGVSADNVRFLVERKLRPLGVLAGADGSTPELARRPPLLALRHRRPLLPQRAVGVLGSALAPLFATPVVAIVLAALVALDAWLLGFHGIAPALRSVLYEPTLLLALVAGVIAATAVHEIGHAAACRYGGARPGAIGAGLYLVWPAFYCDVTDAYRLDRRGRLRTDLGGVYFNGIVALVAGGAYFVTGQEGLLLLAAVQNLTILQQLLPLLRFDGYYVLSDLTGVPDILSRIGPILRGLVPFRRPDAKVRELKPWVRVVVTAYVVLLVPVLLLLLTWIVLGAPRVFATAFDSLLLHVAELAEAVRRHDWSLTGLGSLQVMALVLQCAGIVLILARTGRSAGRGLARWSQGSLPRRAVAVAGAAVVAAAIVSVWWPNGDYRPLGPGERGTIPEGISAVRSVPAAHPVLASGQLGYAPAVDPAGAAAPTGGSGSGTAEPPAAVDAPSGAGRQPSPPDGDPPRPRPSDPPHEDTAPVGGDPAAAAPGAPPGAAPPAPQPGATPGATPSPVPVAPVPPGDNAAVAINTQDGALVFRLAFALQFIDDGVIDQSNSAIAYASCQACRTIAVAVQVLIATDAVHLAAPTNLAVALNEECPSCATLAYAYQLVLALPNVAGLTAAGGDKLKAILAALVLAGSSDAPVDQVRAQLDGLMQELRHVVTTELVTRPDGEAAPAPAPSATTTPNETATATPQDATPAPGESTATPSPDSTAAPSPDSTAAPAPDSTATPSPDSTATPSPDSTATPSPDPAATPSPEPTASPEATATPTP